MRMLRSSRRIAAGITLCLIVLGIPPATRSAVNARTAAVLPCPVAMRLLVIAADGREAVLPAIRETLDYLGTPYDLHVASLPDSLTPAMLSDGGCFGRYQGIMLTNAELGYVNADGSWGSALSSTEWETLRQYEALFKVRRASWYTYPQPQFGYNYGYAVDTAITPVSAAFTPEGAAVFSYLNTSGPVTIKQAYAYLAAPLAADVTPLLTTGDGHALALVHTSADGREHLSLTFDGNEHLLHTISLGYGLVRWVTRGVFLGERHVYMSPQIDDIFIHNDQWTASTPCGTPFELTGYQHRLTASDIEAVLTWQNAVRLNPATAALRLSMVFNGYGATGAYDPDDLTPFLRRTRVKSAFHWINHTFTHENLDAATARVTRYELNKNIDMAWRLSLPGFTPRTLVTPDVSGLTNFTFLRTAADIGVRFVVSDTSRPGYSNPAPNTGIVNSLERRIYMIPRYPNSLFFNVATPDDWTAEYNCIYRSFWNRDLTYQEILDFESDRLLTYLLKGDANPWMFHQTNLDAYDGARTLLTDLLDATLAKYSALYRLPILSPPMQQIGQLMMRRGAYNASGVQGTWHPDGSVTLQVTRQATVPITGLATAGAEVYLDQPITYVTVWPTAPVTIAAQ